MSGMVKARKSSSQAESADEAISFRRPMQVREVMVLGGTAWAVCPRCELTLEREYMSYCDRCGQCLGWKELKKAAIIYPGSVKLP